MPDHVFNSNPGRIEPFASINPSMHDEQPMVRGGSDQRKEQIMRTVTYTFAAALLAAVGQISAASAQTPPAQSSQTDAQQAQSPQANVPQGQSPDVSQEQSPGESDPAANIPNQKLDAAAAAMLRIANLKRDYLQLLEDAPVDDQPRIADEASSALEKAVVDQGLSVEEYSAIVEMAQNDPQVRQKIIERMQAPAK
jgi:tRNA A37 threonylcarbamoyladenosine synthetase subunit TsaC/SUA5/YrdC